MMALAHKHEHSGKKASGGKDGGGRDLWAIEPMPAGLIDSPLDFIFAEHHRQREASSIIMMIADGEFNRKGVERLKTFLEEDFALHIGDEEIVLFPVLRDNCLPEDNVERIIEKLQDEHREDENISDEVIAILKRRLDGEDITENERRRLRLFAEHIRQHLALENGVMLPIARVRLGVHILDTLAEMLKKRRMKRKHSS